MNWKQPSSSSLFFVTTKNNVVMWEYSSPSLGCCITLVISLTQFIFIQDPEINVMSLMSLITRRGHTPLLSHCSSCIVSFITLHNTLLPLSWWTIFTLLSSTSPSPCPNRPSNRTKVPKKKDLDLWLTLTSLKRDLSSIITGTYLSKSSQGLTLSTVSLVPPQDRYTGLQSGPWLVRP